MSSLWYHDHHLDFTAQNVYKGMFGCYNLFDDKDTGDGTGLRLPHGEFDVPIFFNDFLFDQNCQLVFDLFNLDGILGDRFCANGAIQPFLDVKKCRYRFRLYVRARRAGMSSRCMTAANFCRSGRSAATAICCRRRSR